MADDKQLREMTCDPKFRRALVTDGRTTTGQACAKALSEAGCTIVFVGIADPWKPFPGEDSLRRIANVEIVPLDLTNSESVNDLAADIGGRVDILVNTGEHVRPGGIMARKGLVVAREEMDIRYFGLMRLAQAFGPALRFRGADGVNSAPAPGSMSCSSTRSPMAGRPMAPIRRRRPPMLGASHVAARRNCAPAASGCQRLHRAARGRTGSSPCRRRRSRPRSSPAPPCRCAEARARGRLRRRYRAGYPRAPNQMPTPRRSNGSCRSGAHSADLLAFAGAIASGAVRVVDLTHTLAPDFPSSCCRRNSAMRAVPHGGGLALRRARAGLVLEQHQRRRAHGHAFRRADPLDHRPRPARRQRRYNPAAELRRAGLRRRRQRAMRAGCRLRARRRHIDAWEKQHGRIPAGSGCCCARTGRSARRAPMPTCGTTARTRPARRRKR